jgi:predicted PurR-regulated permease PerM
MPTDSSRDLARTTFQLLALGALLATSFWIVRPFLIAFAWATTVVVATWPLLLHAQAWLGGKRSLAVALMTAALLLVLVVPSYFAVTAIVDNVDNIGDWSRTLVTLTVPQPPEWVATLPVVGARLAAGWQQLAASGPEGLAGRIAPYAQTLAVWLVGQIGGIGLLLLQFLLTVIIAAILYANGEKAGHAVGQFARRLAGPQGEDVVQLAALAVRGVALGVVVTAVVQSGLAGIGLAVARVPFTPVLTALMFLLCIAQVGPALVLIPAVFWVYSKSGGGWGTVFLVWAIFCLVLDNVLRPMLIKRGADLPLLLIFTGVIGGLIAFGVIGLFIGPVVLAVAYTLLVAWMSGGGSSEAKEA